MASAIDVLSLQDAKNTPFDLKYTDLVVRQKMDEKYQYELSALYNAIQEFVIYEQSSGNTLKVSDMFNAGTQLYNPYPEAWKSDAALIQEKLKAFTSNLSQGVKAQFDSIRDSSDTETFAKFVAASTSLLKLFTRMYTIVSVQETFLRQKTDKSVEELRQKILDTSNILFTLDASSQIQ